MKIRKLTSFLAPMLALASVLLMSGCGTPAQNVATAHFLAGNAFARWELGKNPDSLKGLQDLSKALPDMASGKVTPFEMGVLNAELQAIRQGAANPALAKNSDVLTWLGSVVSAAVQANAANSGGNPTITTAIVSANLADFANGITHAIQFWQGQQSVRTPPLARADRGRDLFPAYVIR